MPSRVAKVLVWVVLVAMLLLAAPGYEVRYYSCRKCHNLKEIKIRRYLILHGQPMETIAEQFPVGAGHQHEWWYYATHQSQGVGGRLYESAASKQNVFKNQRDRPTEDERQCPAAPDQLR